MKDILYLIILLISVNVFSQEPELYYYNWKLNEIAIDGQYYTPPSNSEVPLISVEFGITPDNLLTGVCNSLEGELLFDNPNTSFTFPNGISTTLIECDNSENSTFEGLYFGFFEDNLDNSFTYIVSHVDFPESWDLIIFAANGDYAYYMEYTLSAQDNQNINFTLYPNPVKNDFFVSLYNNSEKISLTIYNILGEIVLTKKNYKSKTSIDVQSLKSGIYFVSIKDESGNTSVKKLIKK